MKKIKELLSKILNVITPIYKHIFFLPVLFLLIGGLMTPASPFVGGMFFGAMGLKTFEIIYGLNKKK